MATSQGVQAFTAVTDAFGGKQSSKPTGPFAPQYITFVYIPSAILIASTALLKASWTPLALAIAAALGGFQFYANRTLRLESLPSQWLTLSRAAKGP